MFQGSVAQDLWLELKKAYSFGDRVAFMRLLEHAHEALKRDRDELRLLFFIGKEFDADAYEAMLTLLAGWRYHARHADFNYRCASYLYAVRHTMPPPILAAKPYLIPRFLEVFDYHERHDPDTAPVAPSR